MKRIFLDHEDFFTTDFTDCTDFFRLIYFSDFTDGFPAESPHPDGFPKSRLRL